MTTHDREVDQRPTTTLRSAENKNGELCVIGEVRRLAWLSSTLLRGGEADLVLREIAQVSAGSELKETVRSCVD